VTPLGAAGTVLDAALAVEPGIGAAFGAVTASGEESYGCPEVSNSEMTRAQAPAEITVYTLPWCPHCARAKALLRRRELPFHEVDGSGVPEFRRRMAALTGGVTVPQVVIDGEPIGGADRLAQLDRLGVLTAIAAGARFPIAREVRHISLHSIVRWAAARVRGRRGVSAIQRVRLRIDRAGRVVATDHALDIGAVQVEHDGQAVCRNPG
jgi:glutaredoxin 3